MEIRVKFQELDHCVTQLNALKGECSNFKKAPPAAGGLSGSVYTQLENQLRLYQEIGTDFGEIIDRSIAFLKSALFEIRRADQVSAEVLSSSGGGAPF